MGILVWYFVARYKAFNAKALGSTASVLVGGVITKILYWKDPEGAAWYYPIGLLVATVIYWLAELAGPKGKKYLDE
jgi:phosphotransferase system  glucose/maltose/N-acetylglucosamine-specific IIC component